jgi:hypothetical protein
MPGERALRPKLSLLCSNRSAFAAAKVALFCNICSKIVSPNLAGAQLRLT